MRASSVHPSVVTGIETNTYVSTTGMDIGTCPKTAPCATISYAETMTASGGTIHVADGKYNQTVDLTQPVHLSGASESKVIIDGSNIDEGAMGYYGVIGIDNSSGGAGTISISDLTVIHPFVTATEYNADQEPTDIANYDSQSGDTVKVTSVTMGPSQDEADYQGIGYYSLNAASTNQVKSSDATGLYDGYFTEGSGGNTTFANDVANKLVGDNYDGSYYPAAGIWALADTSGSQTVTATGNDFYDYNGWGIVGEAGYSGGNCSQNVCTGGLTIKTDDSYFDLTKAPAGSGVAAIAAYADTNDQLVGNFNYSSGQVVSPDGTVTVVNDGGTVSVTDTHNTIKVES